MNFASLEVCELIGEPFPKTKFAWWRAIGEPNATPFIEDRREFGYTAWPRFHIIANALTCEELGEWIKKLGYFMLPLRDFNQWELRSWNSDKRSLIHGLNETQAREEAIKLILEGKP